ncbi:2-hydroxychromene-2-carboxylate isomerase [Streptomyces sp. SID8382]|uniref:DsbA family protein n=1 Tax=Streptomyces malaysiensis TaxID=92644 RepID=UPI000C2C4F10|nr:DsbA family protein [Streptomyces sp. M56]AUA13557.1 DSBA-like thioredoxin domain protein [Streptomyces sp. M56]MYX57590.1 2-hydroxychromene-2-carboxylate isomerase [Streptomyces sp. SID8382]
MAAKRSKAPRFYFNFRSPYSWIAYRDLMDRYPDVAQAVEWHPWWEPDADGERRMAEHGHHFPYTAMSREKQLYILQDVRRLTTDRGLAVSWPVDRGPVWEVPHLPYFRALDAGLGPAWIERVYRARWLEGRDICDRTTIAAIAAELGLPADRAAAAADDEELRAGRGLQALLTLSDAGAFGVPFFTHGYDKFWGVDRLPAFVDSVRSRSGPGAGSGPRSRDTPPDGPLDADAAGLSDGDFVVARSADPGHAGGCG